MTSYNVAFLSPEPVTMYLSSVDISQLKTEDDSLDCNRKQRNTCLWYVRHYCENYLNTKNKENMFGIYHIKHLAWGNYHVTKKEK